MKLLPAILLLFFGITTAAFFMRPTDGEKPVPITASPQRIGDAAKGYDYLINGNYVRSGLPYNLFRMAAGKSNDNLLQRSGANEKLPYSFTAVTAANGKMLVAPNCLQCHGAMFEGKLYIGLGTTDIDFSHNQALNPKKLQALENFLKTASPKNWEAASRFITVTKTVGPYLTSEVQGVNMADRLAVVLAAHRDPVTFAWHDDDQLGIPAEAIPTDTPPWWLLRKKNAMFYNGFGRGDFGRFLMASNLLTANDTTESAEVDAHMPDLLAYIYSIEPPKYTKPVDAEKATQGKIIFTEHCSGCHGDYGDLKKYPNLLIPESIVKTDSLLYQSNFSNPQFLDWFKRSWLATGDHPAQLEPFAGYIAPPLDGIWMTAPYLHKASKAGTEPLCRYGAGLQIRSSGGAM